MFNLLLFGLNGGVDLLGLLVEVGDDLLLFGEGRDENVVVQNVFL